MVWRKPPKGLNITLKQCWFLGCHSDIGGGTRNPSLSNIALAWMFVQLEDFIDLELNALDDFKYSLLTQESNLGQYEVNLVSGLIPSLLRMDFKYLDHVMQVNGELCWTPKAASS